MSCVEDDEDDFGEAEASRSVKEDGDDDDEESPTSSCTVPYIEGVVAATRRPLWVVAVSSSSEKGMLGGMMDASSQDSMVLWCYGIACRRSRLLMGEGTNQSAGVRSKEGKKSYGHYQQEKILLTLAYS